MKKAIQFFTCLMAFLLVSAFTDVNSNKYIGTFGVSSNDPSQIKLTINSDHTFYYQDFSVSSQKIVAEGKWILKGKKIILESNKEVKKFHNVWTFAENGEVAKSRKGLNFYRLTRIN